MKYFLLLLLYVGAATLGYSQSTQITSATVSFNFVKKDVSGSISGFSSNSKIDWDNLENSVIEGQVKTETLKTGNFVRDWSLKSGKYFDTDAFPLIKFKSNRMVKEANGLLVYGTLILKGISKPIEIKFTKAGSRLTGTTTLFTADYDIAIYKNNRTDNKVTVTLKLEME